MLKPIFIHKQEPLDKSMFLVRSPAIVTYTRGDKLSKQHSWEIDTEPHDTVHILVNNTDTKELLLVKQVRIPVLINQPDIANGIVIEAAAGLIDGFYDLSHRPIEQASCIAVQEVREELGYQSSTDKLAILPSLLTAVGTKGSTLYPFYCEVTNADFVGQSLEQDEDIKVFPLPYDQVKVFLENTTNTDAVTKMLLQWFIINKGQ